MVVAFNPFLPKQFTWETKKPLEEVRSACLAKDARHVLFKLVLVFKSLLVLPSLLGFVKAKGVVMPVGHDQASR